MIGKVEFQNITASSARRSRSEALAVFELLDDPRELICSRYLADSAPASRSCQISRDADSHSAHAGTDTPRPTSYVTLMLDLLPHTWRPTP